MQALDQFALISRVLGREAEEVIDLEGLQVGEVVAEGAGLRRAASRTGSYPILAGRPRRVHRFWDRRRRRFSP